MFLKKVLKDIVFKIDFDDTNVRIFFDTKNFFESSFVF